MGIIAFGAVRITKYEDGELFLQIVHDEWTCIAQVVDVELHYETDDTREDEFTIYQPRSVQLHGRLNVQGPIRRSSRSVPISELAHSRKIGYGDHDNMTTPVTVENWSLRDDG